MTMADAFSRTRLLLGSEAMARLRAARVAVFGLGGVGGGVVEALARSGVGALELIDSDRISESNLNRQLLATRETIGLYKTEAAAARIRSINPACEVVEHRCFYLPENADGFDLRRFDYVVDAIDTVAAKLALAERAAAAGVPIISSMGTGNKLDPCAFRVGDISETSMCPLARVMRKELRRRGIDRLKVVYSTEEPLAPAEEADEAPPQGRRSIPGSVAFVPAAAGFMLAGAVVRDLTGK